MNVIIIQFGQEVRVKDGIVLEAALPFAGDGYGQLVSTSGTTFAN